MRELNYRLTLDAAMYVAGSLEDTISLAIPFGIIIPKLLCNWLAGTSPLPHSRTE
jgi:hypothetical protein